jgi:DNA-binding NarL/FixJ family response regulator
MKVYLVEDSAPLRERLHAMLAAIPGVQVSGEAATAAEAIRGILAERPDAVVLDLQLAEGSGFDVMRALERERLGAAVYVLSNYAADPYRRLAERLGASGFFDKTHEFERVRDAIARRAINPLETDKRRGDADACCHASGSEIPDRLHGADRAGAPVPGEMRELQSARDVPAAGVGRR